jgi:5-(carboxyamino)imidazole ribonucleotide synthase
VLTTLEYVGVLAIELFETRDGLVANEMAPRVHNSGHWTIEGAETSQFENQVRAVCGLPLGATAMRGNAAMVNVIGNTPDIPALLAEESVHVHMYGKREASRRKLGHVTVCAADATVVQTRVAMVRRALARNI